MNSIAANWAGQTEDRERKREGGEREREWSTEDEGRKRAKRMDLVGWGTTPSLQQNMTMTYNNLTAWTGLFFYSSKLALVSFCNSCKKDVVVVVAVAAAVVVVVAAVVVWLAGQSHNNFFNEGMTDLAMN